MVKSNLKKHRGLSLFTIIIAGESIFFLPFVMARIFRPSLLVVFNITNAELGSYFSIYGIIAMFSYFLGGPLADKYSARNLMSFAIWLTALGGFVMFFLPTKGTMMILYALWGVTTILLFWAAFIRATREWGGVHLQGRAFGYLEAGRGATAALLGTSALLVFAEFNPESTDLTVLAAGRISAYRNVILFASIFITFSGALVWWLIPDNKEYRPDDRIRMSQIITLAKSPSLWLLALIIICAYVAYKTSDIFSLYANEVLGYDEVKSAALGTSALWMRAIVAILAAYLADKVNASKIISFGFAISFIAGGLVALGVFETTVVLLLINLALVMVGVYGIRALYFALIQEARIPIFYTGTAVGIISVIGFTPDIFMSPWMGYLLDNNPGPEGHRLVFAVLTMFALLGLLASLLFIRINKTEKNVSAGLYIKND